jgi:hypothetical protein
VLGNLTGEPASFDGLPPGWEDSEPVIRNVPAAPERLTRPFTLAPWEARVRLRHTR